MPNWRPKGRYDWFFAMREDTEEVVRTRMVRPASALFSDEAERRGLADGTRKAVRVERGCAPEVCSWPDVDVLRRWAADGARITAGLVKIGKGMHVIWDEAVPVLLDALDAPAAHQGARLVLHTRRFDAAVAHDVSLFALADWADNGDGTGTGRIALPLPGLTVYGIDETGYDVVTLSAFGRGGAAKATATPAKSGIPNPFTELELPSGTVYLEVTAPYYGPAVRPLVTTAEPVVGEFVGGFEESTGGLENGYEYTTLTAWGVAEMEEYQETITFDGTDYTVDVAELGPPGLARLLVHDEAGNPFGYNVITQDAP